MTGLIIAGKEFSEYPSLTLNNSHLYIQKTESGSYVLGEKGREISNKLTDAIINNENLSLNAMILKTQEIENQLLKEFKDKCKKEKGSSSSLSNTIFNFAQKLPIFFDTAKRLAELQKEKESEGLFSL